MKAAVVREFGAPLELADVPTPEPGEGEVLIKLEASGICHTDIHAAYGDWPVKPKLPLIPGHEGVGRVVGFGPGNTGALDEGDLVAVPWLGYACGMCRYCNTGRETLCELQIDTGYFKDGGYAEYSTAFARHAVKVPKGIPALEAAPLTCAGVTTYKAVKEAGAGPASVAAIFGAGGGLGHLAIQYARLAGSTVVAVDLVDAKLETAKQLGADFVINAAEQDPVEEIKKLGGADTAVSVAVSPKAFEQAFASLARGGTLVFVGLPADNFMKLPIFETVLNGLTIKGSIVGTRHDLEKVFALHALGRTKVLYETRKLDQVNEAFQEVIEARTQQPRLVFQM
jgi:alcohol dehydrogenase, propanol-preferring